MIPTTTTTMIDGDYDGGTLAMNDDDDDDDDLRVRVCAQVWGGYPGDGSVYTVLVPTVRGEGFYHREQGTSKWLDPI